MGRQAVALGGELMARGVRVLGPPQDDRGNPTGSPQGPGPAGALGELRGIVTRQSGDVLAGVVASLVTIAYCVSFSALVFQGELRGGLAQGLWALLTGAAITGVIVSMTTTLPPADAGPDNPAIAVLSVLAMTIAAPLLAAGQSLELAVRHVLLGMTLATLSTGVVLWLLGRFRLGPLVRFVPYPVIGGFLAASGWLLVTGGVEVITGRDITLATLVSAVTVGDLPRVGIAFAFAIGVLVARQRTGNVLVLPAAFFGTALLLGLALLVVPSADWFLKGSGALEAWNPVRAAFAPDTSWSIFLRALPEFGAVAGVTVLALVLDISSLEVARSKVADLDAEFRSNGGANIVAAPLGGFIGNLSLNASRMLEESGGKSRLSGLYAALVVALVVIARVDLAALVPTPVLGGLLIYMGFLVLREALLRSPAQRSILELALAIAIMVAIVQFGYLTGVVMGFVGASLVFAFNYGRIGVIRRHVTRAEFGSNVERASESRLRLETEGHRIHVFWLSGFIFFGSSNGVFERIAAAVGPARPEGRRYVVLDFTGVSGCDTSAVLSMIKLANWAREARVTLAWAALSPAMEDTFRRAGLLGGGDGAELHASRSEALEWCEEQVLGEIASTGPHDDGSSFEAWLAEEIGDAGQKRLVAGYLERRELAGGDMLYAEGAPADTIDLVATGSVAVTVADAAGRMVRVRRMAGRTVVGEMGFFRAQPRAASVVADGPTVVYVLTRARFEALMAEDPALGGRFLAFIVRTLSDRVAFANKEIAALL